MGSSEMAGRKSKIQQKEGKKPTKHPTQGPAFSTGDKENESRFFLSSAAAYLARVLESFKVVPYLAITFLSERGRNDLKRLKNWLLQPPLSSMTSLTYLRSLNKDADPGTLNGFLRN